MLREKILKKLGYKTRPIEDLIAEERKKWESDLIEQIEKMKRNTRGIYGENLDTDWTMGYNQAIEDLINLLKK